MDAALHRVAATVDYVYAGSRLVAAVRMTHLLSVEQAGAGHVSATWPGQEQPVEWPAGSWRVFPSPTSVTLTATPVWPWTFDGWEGACAGSGASTTVLVYGLLTCTASFALPPAPYSFTIEVSPVGGGTVRWAQAGAEHTCPSDCGSEAYATYSVQVLAAPPTWGWRFDGWSGCTLSAETPPSVTVDGAIVCTARFARLNASDFAGDGTADIVWHNTATGQNLVWYLNTVNRVSYGGFDWLQTGAAGERHVAPGDFNADGYADLGWRTLTAAPTDSVWHLQGAAFLDAGAITAADPGPVVRTDPNWRIVGSGDFNGDGTPDVVWRHAVTGANAVWFLHDRVCTGWANVRAVTDPAWRIVAVGDFTGDGKPDLVWRNATTGQNLIWVMDGVLYLDYAWLPTIDDMTWWIVAAGDFDADGQTDLLWRNLAATGANAGRDLIWFFSGAVYVDWAELPVIADQTWVIGSGSETAAAQSGPQMPAGASGPGAAGSIVPASSPRRPAPAASPMPPVPAPSRARGVAVDHSHDAAIAATKHTSPAIGLPAKKATAPSSKTAPSTPTSATSGRVGFTTTVLANEFPPAAPTDSVQFYHADALGSVRVVTDATGTVVSRHDFMPFGEELAQTPPNLPNAADSHRFTGKERDSETTLDYFGARYLASDVGRFTTIDPVYTWTENLVDPQRWNRYAYVRNNPLRYIDPDGKEIRWAAAASPSERRELARILVDVARRESGRETIIRLAASSDVFEIGAGHLPDSSAGTTLGDIIPSQGGHSVVITLDLGKISQVDPLKDRIHTGGTTTMAHELYHADSFASAPRDGTGRWRFVGAGDYPTSATGQAEKWAVALFNAPKKIKKEEAEKLVGNLVKEP